jgi:hypothetical protein
MPIFAKTTLLGFTLTASLAFAAHAQSGSVAALPPGAGAAPPAAATAPVVAYPGPNPGAGGYSGMGQNQPVAPSTNKQAGTSAGGGWYPQEQQTQPVQTSQPLPGPRPN